MVGDCDGISGAANAGAAKVGGVTNSARTKIRNQDIVFPPMMTPAQRLVEFVAGRRAVSVCAAPRSVMNSRRATSGHAAAEPATNLMKSRRLICLPDAQDKAPCGLKLAH
jgi:hypothetical protein